MHKSQKNGLIEFLTEDVIVEAIQAYMKDRPYALLQKLEPVEVELYFDEEQYEVAARVEMAGKIELGDVTDDEIINQLDFEVLGQILEDEKGGDVDHELGVKVKVDFNAISAMLEEE